MSAESPKLKPTRSSLRQSLNLASVGKALGFAPDAAKSDAGKEVKNAKKAKETASRRNSALYTVAPQQAAPRNSMGDSRPPSVRTATPEGKTVTRRRVSASHQRSAAGSSDEQSAATSNKTSEVISPAQPTTLSSRVSTLRAKSANATSGSALPKYRPKSVVVEQAAKPPSPVLVRTGTRRRLSSSDDEKKDRQNRPVIAVTSPAEKNQRPISPLPQRAALKANLTNSLNVSPHNSPTKPKFLTPGSAMTSSPSRPNKIVKTSTATSRPPSSNSSSAMSQAPVPKSSTPTGSTPKSSGLKAKLGLSGRSGTVTPSNGMHSPHSRDSPSPLAHRTRPGSTKMMSSSSGGTSSASASGAGNMSHISEATSEDEDDEDIEILLAPVAALGAPTPAMPRIQPGRKRLMPQTPTRVNLPTRSEMSYTSPFPPTTASNSTSSTSQNFGPTSSSSLKLRALRPTANEKAMRGSIMSWEQLANETSVTLGEDEFGRMLADIPAPFRSGAVSPSLSSQISMGHSAGGLASMPGSPLLLSTALDSPGGYGSISQVLLPDVTPSPAAYMHSSTARFSLSPDAGAQDAANATMLRLQLAAAENAARERLAQVQALEEELHELASAGARQAEEAAAQIAYMEAQWRAGEAGAGPHAVEELEERLRDMRIAHESEVKDAVARAWTEAEGLCVQAIEQEKLRSGVLAAARLAEAGWGAVKGSCETELDVVRDDRAVLALLLGQLDQLVCAL